MRNSWWTEGERAVAAQPPPDMLAALRERYAAARRAALPGKAESSLPTSLPCDPGQGLGG